MILPLSALSFLLLQISWQYIATEPLPLVAKLLAAGSANGTASNSFYATSNHLYNYNDTTVNSPNHDTLYSQAFLDLSQASNSNSRLCKISD